MHRSSLITPDRRPARCRSGPIKSLLAVAVAASALAVGAIAPAPASAASRITGCFNYNGVAVRGLYAIAEVYYSNGQWKAAPGGALGLTNSNGCVAFNIAPAWRRTYMRISAIGYVPSWNLIVVGSTPHYGPADDGGWYLGNAAMRGYRAPAPVREESLTGSWLDGVTGSSGPSSPSLLAGWIDQRLRANPNLRADVVVNTCWVNGVRRIC